MDRRYLVTQVVDLLLSGMSQKEVAAKLDVTPVTISNWTRTPEYREELDLRLQYVRENTLARHQVALGRAFSVIEAQLSHEDPDIAFRAAKYLMDRFPLEQDPGYAADAQGPMKVQMNEISNGELTALLKADAGAGHD